MGKRQKDYWKKWEFNDWRTDPAVRKLSLEGRGLWHELLNLMFATDSYQAEGTIRELTLGVGVLDMAAVERGLKEIDKYDVAEVEQKDETWRIVCRRLKREHRRRAKDRRRKREERNDSGQSEQVTANDPKPERVSGKKRGSSDTTPAKIYIDRTGYTKCPAFFQDLINQQISDHEFSAWDAHVQYWVDSGYKETNVKACVASYHESNEKLQQQKGGAPQKEAKTRMWLCPSCSTPVHVKVGVDPVCPSCGPRVTA